MYGIVLMSCCVLGSSKRRPIRRFTAKNVEPVLVTAWRLAAKPTIFSDPLKATYDGVVRKPSAFSSTRGLSPSITATHEYVVPRSMPITSPWTFSVEARRANAAGATAVRQARRSMVSLGWVGLE